MLDGSKEDKREIFIAKSIRVFLSYSTEDKLLAGALKKGLERFGMSVFLAHDDITPSEIWQDTILNNLKKADIFIPLLTKNFKESLWTDQETGIAYAGQKVIIPVKAENFNPYGFIGKFQAFKLKFEKNYSINGPIWYDCDESCLEIVKLISGKTDFEENVKDSIIVGFSESWTYREAESKARLLEQFDGFSKEQIDEIIKASMKNNQIYEANYCRIFLKNFILKYSEAINPDDKKLLKDLIT